MTRGQQLAQTLTAVLDGDPWFGPSLKGVLQGVTPSASVAKLLPGAHTIWEIAAHIDAWNRVCLRRLAGETVAEPPVNFPEPGEISPASWHELQVGLDESCRALIARTQAATDDELGRTIGGKDYSADFLLEGVGQHWVYHAGQIAILRVGSAATA